MRRRVLLTLGLLLGLAASGSGPLAVTADPLPLSASIRPIESNPIPLWASNSDRCNVVKSCDACTGMEGAYCKYTNQGEAQCCVGEHAPASSASSSASESSSHSLSGGIAPIVSDPIPSWASKKDKCEKAKSCDDCSSDEGQYCKYKKGKPFCCKKKDGEKEESGRAQWLGHEQHTLIGGITPISSNPLPRWASEADKCSMVASCDACTGGHDRYCKYNARGQPSCCVAPDNIPHNTPATLQEDENQHAASASIRPIEKDPIPSWASERDVCQVEKSCDSCSSEQYCKYSSNGQPSCCSRSGSSSLIGGGDHDMPRAHPHHHKCKEVKGCADCQGEDKFCKVTRKGKTKCCTRKSAFAQQLDGAKGEMPAHLLTKDIQPETPRTLEATITPITESGVPAWASPNDKCKAVKSCDDCHTHGRKYCKFAAEEGGQAYCCKGKKKHHRHTFLEKLVAQPTPAVLKPAVEKPADLDMHILPYPDPTSGPRSLTASITPIVEGVPSWASNNDVCEAKRSCDQCEQGAYCKYTNSGRPTCCRQRQRADSPDIILTE